ncbi:MAG TPA: NAD(P)/FAD-dependent oxidoreductase [Clostridiaceae bacterium]|nr:NAD(P)/FAD-dependent oxidoreductase [Clostridiaceae bacterium]
MRNVIVVGAGPSGLMAAISASQNKENRVTLIDRNGNIGKKLFITGKGRCNVTSSKDISEFFENIPKNREFLYSALYSFTNLDTMDFFIKRGLKLKVERGDRVFPESDKSSDVIAVFQQELLDRGITTRMNTLVTDIVLEEGRISSLQTNKGEIQGDVYIFASGGASYFGTGSDAMLHQIIAKTGHTIVPLKPSLIPMVCSNPFIKELQGLSLKNVRFTLRNGRKKVYEDFGEMLFTHFGISGPIILSSSAYYEGGKAKGIIDLKPALDMNELDLRLMRDFAKYANKDFRNSLDDLLPSKLIPVVVSLSKIDPMKKVHSITREERRVLGHLLKNFEVDITGVKSINEAIITRGGVSTLEIDPSSMKSKLVDNLFFAGELIDVDALTGGFNLQIAFSTGHLAGSSV